MGGYGPRRWQRSIWSRDGWVLFLVAIASVCVLHVVRPGGFVGQGTYLLMTMGAAPAAWIGVRRQPRHLRFPWACVAIAVAFSGIADAIYFVMGLGDSMLSDVTIADGFWLGSYIAFAVGLSSLLVGGRGVHRIDVDGLIDIGSFAVLAVIMATQVSVVRDLMADTSYPMSTRVVWTAYPILDAALLGVLAQAMVSRRLRSRGGALVTIGVVLWLISDFASLVVTGTATVRWLDVGWMLGAAVLAAAAWPRAATDPGGERAVTPARVTDARIFITLLPLLVPGVIEVYGFVNGRDPNPVPLFVATLLLVMLAFARSTRLMQARNRQEAELERSTHLYAALAENSSDAVIVIDADGRLLNDAPNLATMLGRRGVTTIGMDAIGLIRPLDQASARAALDRWRSTSGVVIDTEVEATRTDGLKQWFGVRVANLSDDPLVSGLVINLRDISDRKRAEGELDHSAFHDALTGLANRGLLFDRLGHALERTARTASNVAVIHLDLDGFKLINDGLGHDAGDQILREVATRLMSAVRGADTVSRLGGDEFAILTIESPRARDEAETVAERILQSLTAPFVLDGRQLAVSASIGIAVGDILSTATSMMRDADVAMYKAKTTGKAKVVFYEPAMRVAAVLQREFDRDLRQALAKQQLRLVYQPVIALGSNSVAGFEALLRWDHPTRGVISPVAFIPSAEMNGTIVAIGQWVLQEACRTAAQWRRSYPAMQLTMAVNLSARQIATPDIVQQVADALTQSGLPASSLILEMTESVLVEDAETAARRLQQLRTLGVRLAIDDFGTGYSSLGYLRQFPIDILKIDKTFIDTITDRSPLSPIVQGMLELAKTLHLETVAEGIEFDVQRVTLRDQHCEFGQGFLFAKPLDVEDADALLSSQRVTVGRSSLVRLPARGTQ